MNSSEQTDLIAPAWVVALQSFPDVAKDAKGNWGKYATVGACQAAVKPVLKANGLAIQQYHRPSDDGKVVVVTRVWHTSGQWLEDDGLAMAAPHDPQKVGGAITYGKRYSLTTFCGIATEDDDGQSASDHIRAEADAIAARTDRAREAFAELKRLSAEEKQAIKDWANGRSLTATAMADDEQWLAHVESYLDEMKAATT